MNYLRKKRNQRDYRLKQFMITGPRMIMPKSVNVNPLQLGGVWAIPDPADDFRIGRVL